MRALTYHGANDVRVDTVPDPGLQEPDDIILRVTATAICGSDLHLYRGKIPRLERGDIFGHEFMGIVEEAGSAVTAVQPRRPCGDSLRDRLRQLLLLPAGSVRRLRNHQYGARRDHQQERHPTGGRPVRLQPPVRRRAWRAGRIRARTQSQCRAVQSARGRWPTTRCCSCPTSCRPPIRR